MSVLFPLHPTPPKMTCDSNAEMHQLVTGFRDLQSKCGK
ncbi:unnamed protein product [Pylaiella littoralis]